MNFSIHIKRLVFYWVSSFVLATVTYFLLWALMTDHSVFGALDMMYLYHFEHPIQFIIIPCFFYGILATLFANSFLRKGIFGRIILTLILIILTILLSSPFGGMLWYFYYFKAGYFPVDWFSRMLRDGVGHGFLLGWLIVVLSLPYNIICSIVCFFLTWKGAKMFIQTKEYK